MKSSGFVGGSINQCLYVKKSTKHVVHVALYVDDNLMIRDTVAINDTMKALKNRGLVLKIMEGLQNYSSFKIKFLMIRSMPSLDSPT